MTAVINESNDRNESISYMLIITQALIFVGLELSYLKIMEIKSKAKNNLSTTKKTHQRK